MFLSVSNQKLIGEMNEGHVLFHQQSSRTFLVTFLAVFILIGSVLVITSGAFCLSLRDVDVMKDFILPAAIPGGLGIATSIPLMILGVEMSSENQKTHKTKIIDNAKTLFASSDFQSLCKLEIARAAKEKKENKPKDPKEKNKVKNLIAHHLVDEVIPKDKSIAYKQKLLNDFKAEFVPAESPTPEQEAFGAACDEALQLALKKK